MPKFLRKFLSSITIAAMISTLVTVSVVFAAAGEGTATVAIGTGGTGADDATFGSNAASGTVSVGALSYLKLQITVGASHIASTQNNVTIQVPTNLFSGGNTFDTDGPEAALGDVDASGEYFISYTDTDAGTTNNAAISFAASDAVNTGLITVQANQQMDSTDIITVYVAVKDLNYVRAAQTVTISIDDAGANSLVAIGASPTVATTATDVASASIVVATPTVGGVGNVTTTLTVPFALDSQDTIDITFPDFMDVSAVDSQVATGTFDDGGSTLTCTAAAQVVTCTVSVTTTQTTGTIILTGITSTYVGSTDVTVFEVEDEGVAANDIGTDTSVAMTNITAGALSSTNVEPQLLVISTGAPNVITFTTTNTIPSGGKIQVTYPSGYDVSGANGKKAYNLSGLTGTWTASVSGQVITLTQTGGSVATAGAKSLTLEGIINPPTPQTTDTYTISTLDASSNIKDSKTDVSADTIVGGGSSSSSDSESVSNSGDTSTPADSDSDTPADASTEEDAATEDTSTTTEEGATDDSTDSTTVVTEDGQTVTISDISDHWGATAIETMVENGVVKGNPDGTFKPDSALNRAEAAALIFRVLNMGEDMAGPEAKPFTDVELGLWYTIYVDTLKTIGVVHGNPDGTYKPSSNINRAEFLTLAMNAYYYMQETSVGTASLSSGFADVKAGTWYTNVVYLALEMKFVAGTACGEDTCFNPGADITRAEATQMLYNIFYPQTDATVEA